jgi:sugar lactone lactonase YvrE
MLLAGAVALGVVAGDEPPGLGLLAGSGAGGFSGQNIAATAAELRDPGGMAISRNGILFFCDTGNHAIRQIDSRGTISAVAGNGEPGFTGDWGAAVKGQLHGPARLCLDSRDNLWIADTLNHCIRRIGSGKIGSLVGRRGPGFAGDGGPAEQAKLNAPEGVTFDPEGNFFVADTKNHRIRRVDQHTGIITTFAGTGEAATASDGTPLATASINSPRDLVADAGGRLWVATDDGLVRLDPKPGVLRRPAAASPLRPGAMCVAADGRLFIADSRDGSVRALPVSPADAPWQVILPPGTLSAPRGITWNQKTGTLIVANSEKHRLLRVSLPGVAAQR